LTFATKASFALGRRTRPAPALRLIFRLALIVRDRMPDADASMSSSASSMRSSPSTSSSSSSSSSLAMDDDSAAAALALENAWETSNHGDYVAGSALIDALTRAKARVRASEVREIYVQRFAMREEQWLAWIRDAGDVVRARNREERRRRAYELFARALDDVGSASAELALGRALCTMDLTMSDDERRREFERAVAGAGLNYADGGRIWTAYRAFESTRGGETSEKVAALFKRQLMVPHAEHEETWAKANEYAAMTGARANELFGAAYAAGRAAKELREPYEAQIVLVKEQSASGETMRAYKRYIDFEIAQGEPVRAEHLYERALLVFPYVGELWRDYVVSAHKIGNDRQNALLMRALRMCPSSTVLWTHAVEHHRSRNIEDAALEARFRDAKDTSVVLKATLERQFWDGEPLDIHRVIQLARLGIDRMKSAFSANSSAADAIDVLKMFVAPATLKRLAQSHDDLWVPVRDFFAEIAEELPFKIAAEFVVLRAEFEATEGAKADVLKIFDKALQRGVEPVGLSKKTVDEARRLRIGQSTVLSAKLRYLALVDTKAHEKTYVEKTNRAQAVRDAEFEAACERADASAAAKARMRHGPARTDRSSARASGDKPQTSRKRVRGEEDADNADMKLKGMDHDERVKALFPDRDARTVFVKNLSWDVTDVELAEFFDGKGGSVNARIVKDKTTGRPRGFAYVDFSEDAALAAAIMRSGERLKGRAIDVAKSRPPSSESADGAGRSHGRGRGRNVPLESTRGGRGGRGGLGLLPRSVAVVAPSSGGTKTNADFRELFVTSIDDKTSE